MFELLNLNRANKHLAIKITSPAGDTTELTIGPMISKRNRDELVPEKQFELLNGYLDYKGNDFKTLLFMAILDGEYFIEEASLQRGLDVMPTTQLNKILDMFVLDDVIYYIRELAKVIPPENLKPGFDPRIESDGLGTRAQTYIQQDYYELAALTLPIKAIIGLLGQYAIRKGGCIAPIHKEYVLYSSFAKHVITKYIAVSKLRAWIDILVNINIQTSDMASITVIEKQIPSSELPTYILAVVLIQKLSIAAIVTDTRERNVITRIYNYIINKLKTKGGPSTKIRDKTPKADVDSSSGDKESVIEAYRVVADVTMGAEVELSWYAGDINMLIRDIGRPVNMALLSEVLAVNQCFRTIPISKEQVTIVGYMFKRILDPRALDYIDINGIINLISVGFTVLWGSGHRELAMLLIAKPLMADSNDVIINITPNIRLLPEYKLRLAELYPYEKQLNKTKTVSVVEAAVTDLTCDIFAIKWLPNMPKCCIDEHFGDNPVKILPANFKNLLVKLIIELEEE